MNPNTAPSTTTFPLPSLSSPPPARAASSRMQPSRSLQRRFESRAFYLPCLSGLSPGRTSRSSPEPDVAAPLRSPRPQPFQSASSTSGMPKPWKPLCPNLIRADVHSMEEADGFLALLALEEPKYSIEQIASRTGKSAIFIASRLRLTELTPVIVEAFYREEIGVGHVLLLAKLQPAPQEQALPNCFREDWGAGSGKAKRILLPVRHLQHWIEHNVLLLLKQAPFNKPSLCNTWECPSNSH